MTNNQPKMMKVRDAVYAVTGTRPSPTKCWRWYQKGIKGVVLQTWVVGGSRLTTVEAVREFIAERTVTRTTRRSPKIRRGPPSLDQRTKDILNKELGLCLK